MAFIYFEASGNQYYNGSTIEIGVGETITLTAFHNDGLGDISYISVNWISPGNGTYYTVDSSSDTTITISGLSATSSDSDTIIMAMFASDTSLNCMAYIRVVSGSINVYPTSVYLPGTANVNVGSTITLTATVYYSDGSTNSNIAYWTTSNSSVATVSNGIVTGISAGTATIRAYAADDTSLSDYCNVTVNAASILIKSIDLINSISYLKNNSLTVGETYTVSYTINPSNATNKKLNWTSNNTSVARVSSSGVITAIGAGTTYIDVETTDGSNISYSFEVSVVEAVIEEGYRLYIDCINYAEARYDYGMLSTIVDPNNSFSYIASDPLCPFQASNYAESYNVERIFNSSNDNRADVQSIDYGVHNNKTVIIYAKYRKDGSAHSNNDSLQFKVRLEPEVASFDYTVTNVNVPSTTTTGTNYGFQFNGTYYESQNGQYGTGGGVHNSYALCKIEITIPDVNAISVTGVRVSPATLSLKTGNTATLTATVQPSNATVKTVAWTSSSSTVASVSSSGIVTAKAEGTATITATTTDGGYQASCIVTVKEQITLSIDVDNPLELELKAGVQAVIITEISPSTVSDENVTFTFIDNNNIVGINFSNNYAIAVYPISVGTAYLEITSNYDPDVKILLEIRVVIPEFIPVTSITLYPNEFIDSVTSSNYIEATVLPENATTSSITWSVSDPSLVSIEKYSKHIGLAHLLHVGTVTVTATADDGSGVYGTMRITARPKAFIHNGTEWMAAKPYICIGIDENGKATWTSAQISETFCEV